MVPYSDTRPGVAGALLVALLVDVLATLINLVAVVVRYLTRLSVAGGWLGNEKWVSRRQMEGQKTCRKVWSPRRKKDAVWCQNKNSLLNRNSLGPEKCLSG